MSKERIAELARELYNLTNPEEIAETPPKPTKPKIDQIPVLSQRDPAWRNYPLGVSTGHKATIGSWGCLLVVQTMLARFWGISDRLPPEENEYYVRNGAFNAQFMISMSMSHVYPQVTDERYLVYSRHGEGMHTRAKRYLSLGVPVPARVDFRPNPYHEDVDESHWVLLTAWDNSYNGGKGDYIMICPHIAQKTYVSQFYGDKGGNVKECIYYNLT